MLVYYSLYVLIAQLKGVKMLDEELNSLPLS